MITALRSVRDLCLAVVGTRTGRQALARIFRYILEVSNMRPETMSEYVKLVATSLADVFADEP